MVRRKQDAVTLERSMFGGPGLGQALQILNDGEFAGKGRLFNHVRLAPGCAVGKHAHHGEFEVYYILKGEGTYDDNGTECRVVAGDVTVCPDGETHGLLNSGTEDLEFIAPILFM